MCAVTTVLKVYTISSVSRMSYYTTFNREKQKVTVIEKGGEKDCFLSLAYRELFELPRECIARLEHVQHLDLSNNKFSYPHCTFH